MNTVLKRWSDLKTAVIEQRILLILICLTSGGIISVDKIRISKLEHKLGQKEFILAPGVTDFVSVRPQIIPEAYVKEFSNFFAKSLGSFVGKEVAGQYQNLEKYLSPDFRVRFKASIVTTLKEFESNDVSELFSPTKVDISESTVGGTDGFAVTVTGSLIRFVSGLKVSTESHVVSLDLKAVAPTSHTPWALQVDSFTRQSEQDHIRQKIGRSL
jgi:hypothetical protein